MQHLLISDLWRRRRATRFIDDDAQRRAIEQLELVRVTSSRHRRQDRSRISHEQLFADLTNPVLPRVLAIGICEEVCELRDALVFLLA